jgi:tetratricopeptide (TPR) repeat protein
MSQRLAMLEKLIAQGSEDPFVHYACAMELRNLGRSAEALDAFRALRDRFPGYVPTYLMAGQLALELVEAEVAREFLEQGLTRARAAGDAHAESELAHALAGIVS